MTIDYADYFWGEKHMGFSVLYQNMKAGQTTVKELGDFLKERVSVEDEYGKHMVRNLNKITGYSQSGHSFAPAWVLTRNALDRVHESQVRLVQSLQELGKEVAKYNEELHKTHRQIKEKEHPTFDSVNLMQTTTTCLQKAKETCTTRSVELEKLKRDNASPKEIHKAEVKATKAREEYKQYVEKYGKTRADFQDKMENSARCFQEHERRHLERMKGLLTSYARHSEESHGVANQVCAELRTAIEHLNLDEMMEQFVKNKTTGSERPNEVIYEEPDVASLLPPLAEASTNHVDPTASTANQSSPLRPPQPAERSQSSQPQLGSMVGGLAPSHQLNPSAYGLMGITAPSSANQSSGPSQGSGGDSLISWGSSSVEEDRSHLENATNATGQHNLQHQPPTDKSSMHNTSSRQKLALWLPGRSKKSSSQSTGNTPMESLPPSNISEGFLKKRNKKKKKSKGENNTSDTQNSPNLYGDATNANDETRSSASDERVSQDVQVDDEGFIIRPTDENPHKMPKFHGDKVSSSSDSDSDDEPHMRKIQEIKIKPHTSQQNKALSGSLDELRDAVGQMAMPKPPSNYDGITLELPGGVNHQSSLHTSYTASTMPKSRTFDYSSSMSAALSTSYGGGTGLGSVAERREGDPWAPTAMSARGPVKLLRPALTGDGRLNSTFAGFGDDNAPSSYGLPSGPIAPSLTGSSTRPRPRATTPSIMFQLGRRSSQENGSGEFSRSDSLSSLADSTLNMGPESPTGSGSLLSANDVIPVAMALTETVHAWFQGADITKLRVRVFGSVQVSIPGSAIPVLCAEGGHPPLIFKLCQAERVNAIIPNKQVLSHDAVSHFESSAARSFSFDKDGLANQLKKQIELNPGKPFYNFEVLRYEMRNPVAPLLLLSFWKCEAQQTDFRLDYRLNPECPLTQALLNLQFVTHIGGGVNSVTSKPDAEWSAATERLIWRLTELSKHGESSGSLKSRLVVGRGPSPSAPSHVTFSASEACLSGATLEIENADRYRLSLLKRKLVSGKYLVDPESR